jgi:hypothetical protein
MNPEAFAVAQGMLAEETWKRKLESQTPGTSSKQSGLLFLVSFLNSFQSLCSRFSPPSKTPGVSCVTTLTGGKVVTAKRSLSIMATHTALSFS